MDFLGSPLAVAVRFEFPAKNSKEGAKERNYRCEYNNTIHNSYYTKPKPNMDMFWFMCGMKVMGLAFNMKWVPR